MRSGDCRKILEITGELAYSYGVTHLRRAVGSKAVLGASSGGLLLFLDHSLARTIVYIDGFNLYYRALKGTLHKWLDIAAMSRAVLPPDCQIEAINYYTAHISGRADRGAPQRQHAYLRAIATLPKVAIHFGNFLVSQKWAGLVLPPDFRPPFALPPLAAPEVAYVWKTEEKGRMSISACTWCAMLSGAASSSRRF